MKNLELYTTLEEFEELHKIIDAHRANSKNVTVPRQTLINILMDHSRIIKHLGLK
jgi:hypothetical protein